MFEFVTREWGATGVGERRGCLRDAYRAGGLPLLMALVAWIEEHATMPPDLDWVVVSAAKRRDHAASRYLIDLGARLSSSMLYGLFIKALAKELVLDAMLWVMREFPSGVANRINAMDLVYLQSQVAKCKNAGVRERVLAAISNL